MVFGLRIKEERLKRHLTQKEFGKLLGVSATMIMYYEHGIKKPTIEQLINISETLKKDPNYLLGQEYMAKGTNEEYIIRISSKEVKVLSELRKQPELYRKLLEEPRRTLELISRKLNK